tara:strand:- start:347 stop:829 length:483 start_codon:yes stop_codon:yes gene_type:complete
MKFNIQIAFMIMILISLFLPLMVGYILISYIKSLEDKNCSCSNDRRRKYIKYYGYFLIIFSIFVLVANIIFGLWFNNFFQSLIRIISFGINFLAAYLLYSYSNILEDSTCKCSESWRRTFLKFYGYLLGGVFSFISFCVIFTFIYHISQGDDIIIRRIKA